MIVTKTRARRRVVSGIGVLLAAVWGTAALRAHFAAPAATLLVRDRHGQFLGEIGDAGDSQVGYWPLRSLPLRVVAATVAIEDRRFWHHPGVDVRAIARALAGNIRHRHRTAGGSTLAMQVARLQHPERRTYARKAVEAATAILLTGRYGRAAVLSQYLRLVPYGNRIHGIAYAARRYLDKPVDDLSWAEIAFLTAIPQAPARMNPFEPRGRRRAVARGKRILHALHDQGAVSGAELDLALRQIDQLPIPALARRPRTALHALLRVAPMLLDPAVRRTLNDRPIVDTTFDLDIQEQVTREAEAAVARLEQQGAGNAAVVVVDRHRNEVIAWAGSADYFSTGAAGAIDFARVPRSPGSTLKPFIYALALEEGIITPGTILDDLRRGRGEIVNADRGFLGPLLPRVALANSRNVPAADLLDRVGLDTVYSLFGRLGLHDGRWTGEHYGLGLAIGAMPTTLEHLVRAYTVLAGDGRLSDLRWYAGQPPAVARRILSPETTREVTLFLSDPMARLPTFPRRGSTEYPFPVAVKTGTSQDYRDAWTMAYSTRYLVGVWMGQADARGMTRLSAAVSAAQLAKEVMLTLHGTESDGLNNLSFPPPAGYRPVRICGLTGQRATPACDHAFTEWFRPGDEPATSCAAHRRIAIDRRNGRAATPVTPADFIDVRTVIALDAHYAAWAATAGLPQYRDDSLRPLEVPNIRVIGPADGTRIVRDPENPAATVALEAVVDPPVPQVVWYVDGQPFQVADCPYTARWPVRAGEHRVEARIPYSTIASPAARVLVR